MAGPLDILRSIAGGAGGAGKGRAPSPALPAYSAKDASVLKDVEKRMNAINAAVKQGADNWERMADARALKGARDALKGLKGEQIAFNSVMRDGNVTLEEKIKAYDKLAKARQKATQEGERAQREINESRGALGRFKNVLDGIAKHKWAALLTAAVKDLNLVFGDMNRHFDIMARSGQLTNTTFGSLAKTTAAFSGNMRLAMIQAAAMGISADDSNKAFAQLTETFGGTLDVSSRLRENWLEMSQLARTSGLSMADVAGVMEQGFTRLGESSETSLNNIARMAKVTEELNGRFGKGKVNTRDFAAAVNTLAYSTGFYNQNTRMVIESLGREISAQLALGKSRTAATESAVANLKMAGQVNIVGIIKFRKEILRGYDIADDQAAFLAKLVEDFGSDGKLIANMLEKGTLQSGEMLFAFQDIVKGSSALGASMLENMRITALEGPDQLLAMGIEFGKAMRTVTESRFIADQLQAIAQRRPDAAGKLFGGGEVSAEQAGLIAQLRADPQMDRAAMLKKFYAIGGSEATAKAAMEEVGEPTGEPEWKQYVGSREGIGWFLGVTNILGTIGAAITKLPSALGIVTAGLLARGPMGALLKRLPVGGAGGMVAGRGAAALGNVTAAARALGPLAAIGAQVYAWADGMSRAAEIMGRSEEGIGILERAAAGASNAVSQLTLGLVDAGRLARGETLLQKASYATSYGMLEKTLGLIGKFTGKGTFLGFGDVNVSPEKLIQQEFEHAQKQGWTTASTPQEYEAEKSAAAAVHKSQASQARSQAKAASPRTEVSGATPARNVAAGDQSGGGAGVATGIASVTGGKLIFEVDNWPAVLAQSQNDLSALPNG